ncbi:beta-hexosaminidase precursor [Oxobacter pfennigii]|uniref:beta-N-acetylhexosaminidase n=1 Tax=Oxobacter pfennigii TaxID=36849 RepID=A0A0P9AH40_9CLOT|nr:beta-N-acetylhexosaminidase [Oxobacter pfennigii]KPU44769.1 beta-hexosaminidase precursor [Oxobacter pfennigii]
MLNRYILLIILFITLIFMAGCSTGEKSNDIAGGGGETVQPAKPDGKDLKPSIQPSPTPVIDTIKAELEKMTLDEKIGQMVISGVDGYSISNTTVKLIEDYHVGGFIILGENVKSTNQLLDMVNSLKARNAANKIPLFLSIDQEGGRIDRMPADFKRLPANKAIGAVGSEEFSYNIGKIISQELNAFGFNMDFAPVLDINSNPKNPIIGDRSFGGSADIVTILGIQTMKGIGSGGIIPVVKHFPGHGDTLVDSHVGLPAVYNDIERLKSFELVPFTQAVKDEVDAVMVAHILLPEIDPQYPSSMSKIIITDILRKDLNFDGVVITDDMTMGAITKNYDIGDASVKSVSAGSDIILVCHVFDNEVAVINSLKMAVQNGTLSEERINQSIYRILKLKDKYKINDNKIDSIDVESINNKIDSILKIYMPGK